MVNSVGVNCSKSISITSLLRETPVQAVFSDNARYVTSGSSETSALKAYPIGSIYMSVNSTNPKDLFGGTWQQLQNRFLVGVGSNYSNGATGGASSYTPKGSVGSHTLTTSEIPSHTHSIRCAYTSGGDRRDSDVIVYDGWDMNGYKWTTEWSGSVGGGKGHNHGFTGTAQTILPPYLAVYMWKRTA